MIHFEEYTKSNFEERTREVCIPVPGLDDDLMKNIYRQKLTIPASVIRSLFKPVIDKICQLVLAQIKAAGKVQAVLLVGGFGQSNYLRQSMEKIVDSSIEVMHPPHSQSAVARGALNKALAEAAPGTSRINITSRIARKSYGIVLNDDWTKKKDAAWRKVWMPFSGTWGVQKMQWLVKKGSTLKESHPAVLNCSCRRLVSTGFFHYHATEIEVYDGERAKPPFYPGFAGEMLSISIEREMLIIADLKTLAVLRSDLSAIAATSVPVETGADNKRYYVLDFQIRATFFSASTRYALWYKDICYGTANAEYA